MSDIIATYDREKKARDNWVANRLVELEGQNSFLLATLHDAALQIEYLHGKFRETGSGNAVLTHIRDAIAKSTGVARPADDQPMRVGGAAR